MRTVLSLVILAMAASAPSVAGAAPLGRVQGVVRDAASHTLLSGVRVVAVPANRPPGALLRQATTGNDGSFAIARLAPGRYSILFHIDALGFEQPRQAVAVTGDHVAFVEERLDLSKVTGTIAGKVMYAGGGPPVGTKVVVALTRPAGITWQRLGTVDAQGAFRIGALPPGSYSVRAFVGGASATGTAEVRVGRESRVDLHLARAPEVRTYGETVSLEGAPASGSARSMAASWLVLPKSGLEVGTTLSFVTAPAADGGQMLPGMTTSQLRFTDVVLFGLSARYSLNGKLELHGGTTLLPKQPQGAGNLAWQGALAGGRLAIGRHFAADLDVSGGPLIADQGSYGEAETALHGKATVDEWRSITFEGAVGADVADLFPDGAGSAWFSEALAQANVLQHTPGGEFGGWVGFDLRFPLVHGAGAMGPALDPQTRANFRIGTVYSVARDWDLWAEYAVLDRGDVSDPATTLPILDGGFDQRQLVFGVVRRFDLGRRRSPATIAVPAL